MFGFTVRHDEATDPELVGRRGGLVPRLHLLVHGGARLRSGLGARYQEAALAIGDEVEQRLVLLGLVVHLDEPLLRAVDVLDALVLRGDGAVRVLDEHRHGERVVGLVVGQAHEERALGLVEQPLLALGAVDVAVEPRARVELAYPAHGVRAGLAVVEGAVPHDEVVEAAQRDVRGGRRVGRHGAARPIAARRRVAHERAEVGELVLRVLRLAV
mmetsp:Transcript_29725/g.72341  ORF Transcript_29725/g.72341 Transcript_29725/m.72341 type:complete len:214 (-) Transcript_29725:269-910(-)